MSKRKIFGKGGIIPRASREDDSVPAILSRGCPVLSREQAEAAGLTADAKRLPPEAEVSEEFKRQAAGVYGDDPDLKEPER